MWLMVVVVVGDKKKVWKNFPPKETKKVFLFSSLLFFNQKFVVVALDRY